MSAIPLDYQTWILVADGKRALFLENVGDATLPNFAVRRVEEHENLPSRDAAVDHAGEAPDTHRLSPTEADWHMIAEDRFAKEVAEILYRMAHRNRFRKIVIVAPPHVLGDLRRKLHKEVMDRVVGEIPKTLTNHPVDRIEELLAA